jgi:TonB family protein
MYNKARPHRSRSEKRISLSVGALLLLGGFAINCTTLAAQLASPADPKTKGEIVMIGPFKPSYPPLARQANITGDVELKMEIRRDGSVQSASIVSGHPMLAQAALDSAKRSSFECRGCENAVTVGSVTFSFRIAASPGWPCPETSGPRVTQSGNLVTVSAEPALVHPYFGYTRARSAKCIYLWACGSHWVGEITISILFAQRSAWGYGTAAVSSGNHSLLARR